MGGALTTHKAHATPSKDFFVRMITKDISLEDCILDLIDNCLDGARKVQHAANADARVDNYSGFYAKVRFTGERFDIVDNCGGIKISEAIDYAFHFGRRPNTPPEGEYSIGLYGIGMKRAIFKMGNDIQIYSSTDKEAFRARIDVNEWRTRGTLVPSGEATPPEDWDFDMEDAPVIPGTGTNIGITTLHHEIAAQFANPAFANSLARIVGRDYSQFLRKGFEIFLNDKKIEGFPFTVRESTEVKPIRLQYTDESGVEVEIIAGMAGAPPDDLQPVERRSETDYYGWFVICNDRVVVASDKSDQTVWGDGGFPAWHFQYNGFIGVVSFHSKDPNLLPWRTTKRDVDGTNAAYRRAIEKMKDATRSWIKYTNDRKSDIDEAKKHEAVATSKPLFDVPLNSKFEVPQIATTSPRVSYSYIQYQKPTSDIAKAKKLLGNTYMSNVRLGERTFDDFLKNESEE